MLEERVSLTYAFPEKDALGLNEGALYEATVRTRERIVRGERVTLLTTHLEATLRLFETPSLTQSGEEIREVLAFVEAMELTRIVDGREHRWVLKNDGLLEVNPQGVRKHVAPDEVIRGESTLAQVLAEPGRIRLRGAALADFPTAPAILDHAGSGGVFGFLAALLPSAPEQMIAAGTTWKSGAYTIVTPFAQARVLRAENRLTEVDLPRQSARIDATTSGENLPLVPVRGIHHVQQDARARVNLSLESVIDLSQSRLGSSTLRGRHRIVHPVSKGALVEFEVDASLHLLEDGKVRWEPQDPDVLG